MRRVLDILIVAMVIGLIVSLFVWRQELTRSDGRVEGVRNALNTLREELSVRSALADTEGQTTRHPIRIEADWFAQGLPVNAFVHANQPWMDIADVDDFAPFPTDPILKKSEQAGFWYNPNLGVIHARTPEQFTDQRTLDLYNQVNSTSLSELPSPPQPNHAPSSQELADVESAPTEPTAPAVRRTLRAQANAPTDP